MKTLFFDIDNTGHHSEYLGHLVDHIPDNNNVDSYYFIVHPHFSILFPDISNKAKSKQNIIWVEITSSELEETRFGGIIKKSFSNFHLMKSYAELFNVDHVCLLYFNSFQFALIIFRTSFTISGILFLQFYRMSTKNLYDKLKYYRKYLTTKLYCFNSKITKIYVLNDQKTVDFFNNEFKKGLFEVLPDPIPNLIPLNNFNINKEFNVEDNRKIFLHIGALDSRKGSIEIIESISYLNKEIQKQLCFLYVGKAKEEFEKELLNKIKIYQTKSCVQIIWINSFVSNEMMKSLFDNSYCVLMPYKNAEASSGILGHAAYAGKKVIGTNYGLLKDLIEDNNLGIVVDKVSPSLIADGIVKVFDFNLHATHAESFVSQHTVCNFSEIIFNSYKKSIK